ncbi:aminoacyl-tRNA hydrolase [Candidatus Bathyarchaeota archaeon ex4484_205]|nr:MAG: aminoacyl-tRNA hydrolase [Candidatus Bathyarchaeota archaeon ex4484_205]RLF96193.1 MAG: peptidyl-tRNA hydrolase [Thermococci archaeon]HDI10570.1 peptidyl-tRNA hydrolase [Euryarchaeota archaeon]
MKQVIVVRTDLGMGKGKIAAQVAHGSISSFLKAREMGKEDWINKWIREGQKKIVLKVSGEKELLKLYEKANRRKLPAVLIRDAGLTQIEEGTLTVLAIGPAPCREIDEITGELKLL